MLPFTLFTLLAIALHAPIPARDGAPPANVKALRANYLITAADDFIVDVYLNGKPIPDSKRTMLEERFGATVERIDAEVHSGDWIVFNVVNNRLRWGGTRYFGMAGCFAANEYGFISDRASRQWSACDNPRDATRFITQMSFLDRSAVQIIDNPWPVGDELMRQYAGSNWSGSPVWGKSRNTWIKVIVE